MDCRVVAAQTSQIQVPCRPWILVTTFPWGTPPQTPIPNQPGGVCAYHIYVGVHIEIARKPRGRLGVAMSQGQQTPGNKLKLLIYDVAAAR